MKISVIIPARMASTRFPGKPLVMLFGKPMIQWVYERASRASGVSDVVVATCDIDIIDCVEGFGGKVVMTSSQHKSGTDRVAEAALYCKSDLIVNVQGDELLIDPLHITRLIQLFEDKSVQMASMMYPISREDASDPNLVKVVASNDGNALYFSRSVIPYEREKNDTTQIYGHAGVYAYTFSFLMKYASMQQTMLERAESLEQLRILENGYKIKMLKVDSKPIGVDTPEDLEKVKQIIRERMMES